MVCSSFPHAFFTPPPLPSLTLQIQGYGRATTCQSSKGTKRSSRLFVPSSLWQSLPVSRTKKYLLPCQRDAVCATIQLTDGLSWGQDGDGQGFDALRLLQNYETKNFWAHHFGPKVLESTMLALSFTAYSLFFQQPPSDFQGDMVPVSCSI